MIVIRWNEYFKTQSPCMAMRENSITMYVADLYMN